jgi:hypothetical protein
LERVTFNKRPEGSKKEINQEIWGKVSLRLREDIPDEKTNAE